MPNAPKKLEGAPVPLPVLAVLSKLNKALGFQAYLVGGCVRDALLGKTPKDFDVATNALPEQVVAAFPKVIPTGIEHGTVTVLMHGVPVEVTTFRTEGKYEDGRRPTSVSFNATITEDLSRRDFTINAMAYNPLERELLDPFGGLIDLEAKLIRCVGIAGERFAEDGLRPMRAVRFMAVLGFSIETETRLALAPSVPVFRKVAIERINTEFSKMLTTRFAAEALAQLHGAQLLHEFLPEVVEEPVLPYVLKCVGHAKPALPIRLAALLHPLGAEKAQGVLERLKFPTKTIESVTVLVKHCSLPLKMSDTELRRLTSTIGTENVNPLLDLVEAIVRSNGDTGIEIVSNYRDRLAVLLAVNPPLSTKELALNGKEVMDILGVKPGPIVGEATRFLFEKVLIAPELNTPAALTEVLQRWAETRK